MEKRTTEKQEIPMHYFLEEFPVFIKLCFMNSGVRAADRIYGITLQDRIRWELQRD